MKKRLLRSTLALLAGVWTLGSNAQSVGDIVAYGSHKYKITGENLIVNGSFDDGVNGWSGSNQWEAAEIGNYTYFTEGGFDGGAYLQTNAAGDGSNKSLRTHAQVEEGKMYLFQCYTGGSAPATGNLQYNKLSSSVDGKTESTKLYELKWGKEWLQNCFVFSPSGYSYVIFRNSWTSGTKFDGFFLGTIVELPNTEALEAAITEAESIYSATAEEADALQTAITTAKGYLTSEMAAEVSQATVDLQAAVQSYRIANATPENPVDMTSYIVNANGSSKDGWTTTGNVGVNTSQHWSGENSDAYLEPCNWGASSWNASLKQTIKVPNGKYVLKATGRASSAVTLNLVANDKSYTYASLNDVGGTIATDGTEWETLNQGLEAGKSFANNNAGRGWTYGSVEVLVSDGTLTLGAESSCLVEHNWCSISNFSLTYLGYDNSSAIAALNVLIEEASAQYREEFENSTSLAGLVDALSNKIMVAQEAVKVGTKTVVETASQELREAMNAAKAAEAPLAELKAAYALNANLKNNSTPSDAETLEQYEAALTNAQMAQWSATTVEELVAAINQLETARQAYVLTAYPFVGQGQEPAVSFDLTFKMTNAVVTSAEGWTNGRTEHNQQYTGAPDNTYLDAWNGNFNMSQVVTELPRGIYSLKVATRGHADLTTANVYVLADGQNYATDIHHVGAEGNELGAGWGWTTVDNIMINSGTATIGFYSECSGGKWAGADNFQLSLVRAFTQEDEEKLIMLDIDAAHKELAAKLEEVNALNREVNVGANAFQRSVENKEILEETIMYAEQQMNLGIGETSGELIRMYIGMLDADVEAFETLNVPAETDLFTVSISTPDNYKFKNVPLTFREDGKGGAYFKPGFDSRNYAQSVEFHATEEANVYTLSTVFADGVRRYISTGVTSGNGNNTAQIRLTDDAEKALKVSVKATNEEGVYTLLNTEANTLLGCQDGDDREEGGFYTTLAHSTLALKKVDAPTVTLDITSAGFATVMLPFAAELPAGVKAYTCEASGETLENGVKVLTLNPVESMAANTPYIVEGAAGTHSFTGLGAAYKNEYAAGWLTGTFAEKTAAAGTYVLQNQAENGVGFYAVAEGAEPTIGAYRAWMNVPAEESEVKVFVLGDVATGIDGVAAAADVQVNVYTLNGVLVRRNVKMSEALKGLNKGVYIVNGVKTAVN